MRLFIQTSLAALAIGTVLSLAPAPAAAQHHSCGGSVGEGCWTPRQQQQQQRRWGLPEWKPQQHYGAPVLGSRGHGVRGGRQIAPRPYTYLKSRTCRDWKQPGGVGPKIYGRPYAC